MLDRDNRPLSERIGEAWHRWADLDAAARVLESTKSAVLSQRMMASGEKSVARAELVVKASEFWIDHVTKVEKARTAANHAKADLEVLRAKQTEWQSHAADERLRAKL